MQMQNCVQLLQTICNMRFFFFWGGVGGFFETAKFGQVCIQKGRWLQTSNPHFCGTKALQHFVKLLKPHQQIGDILFLNLFPGNLKYLRWTLNPLTSQLPKIKKSPNTNLSQARACLADFIPD